MERLTYIDHLGWYVNGNGGERIRGSHINRLAAYEDFMDRWHLKSIEDAECIFRRVNDLGGTDLMAQYRELGSINHLRDLLQAEQDGRLVVLPCKVGAHVHGRYENWSGEVMEFSINSDGVHLYVRSGGGGFYCKPEDIEVEAALKGGEG